MKNEYPKSQIICLTTSFTVPLQKDKVNVSHAKISPIFSRSKNAIAEPRKHPLNLFFSVNQYLVFLTCDFFLNVSHTISQNMTFWKEDAKKCKNAILFWTWSINAYLYSFKTFYYFFKEDNFILLVNIGIFFANKSNVSSNQGNDNELDFYFSSV